MLTVDSIQEGLDLVPPISPAVLELASRVAASLPAHLLPDRQTPTRGGVLWEWLRGDLEASLEITANVAELYIDRRESDDWREQSCSAWPWSDRQPDWWLPYAVALLDQALRLP